VAQKNRPVLFEKKPGRLRVVVFVGPSVNGSPTG
jgi:hypothetical protein